MRHNESEIQKNCILWFRLQYKEYAKVIFAVPNGGKRNSREAGRMKSEGVTSGVSDVILLISRNGFNSLCIEFKTPKGKQTDLQREWQEHAERHGNKYVICRSFEDFRGVVQEYLANS